MTELLFDRKLLRQNRRRFAQKFHEHNFIHHAIADILLENIEAQNCKFENALEISAMDNYITDNIIKNKNVERVFCSLVDEKQLYNAQEKGFRDSVAICDDEFLPFKPEKFDLVLSNLNLHHINIIPQFLADVKRILRKNGVFIASFFGENNLFDLKKAVFDAENEVLGQISPRFMPTIDVKNAANLLQKAGFANPLSSLEIIEVEYENVAKLLQDIKFMAQGNILLKRDKKFINRKFFDEILKNYAIINSLGEKKVKARFEIVVMVGWKK
jgi:NADH dehydrogenase [ubiquinone] 1 alpha subcomplex assembly factor 5